MTHSGSTSFGRLDRFYINQHIAEQLDRELLSVALEWRPDLSDHRALLVARRLPSNMDASARPIPRCIYSHPDFARRCRLAFDDKLQSELSADGEAPSRLKQLALLKTCMREVTSGLASTIVDLSEATETSDKLGLVMKFLRSAEKQSLTAMSQCLTRYPLIASLVDNPYDLTGNLTINHRALRDHAVELARNLALEQIGSAQEEEELGQFEATKRRKNGTRLLHKLSPGKCGAIGAIVDKGGKFLTDPQEMSNHLRKHWTEVFQAKGINQEKLQEWLDEDKAQRDVVGPTHEPVAGLRLRRRAIKKALKLSNNSAPGPDGIPYGA